MDVRQGLDTRQSQSLAMTPQLRQAIAFLQMTSQELGTYVTEIIETNPLLEYVDEDTGSDQRDDGLIFDTYSQDPSAIFSTLTTQTSFHEYLHQQMMLLLVTPDEKKAGQHLFDALSETGFLEKDLHTIAKESGVGFKCVLETLHKLQQCDPPGIFARNLKECFRLQLEEMGHFTEEVEIVLENLDLLLHGDMDRLVRATGLTAEECRESIEIIRRLNPKPAAGFDPEHLNARIPDVIVGVHEGQYSVALNPQSLPRIYLNSSYYHELSQLLKKDQDVKYLQEKHHQANWLIKALHQRTTTLIRVSQEILSRQQAYFSEGPEALKPLTLKDIAESLNMHESTISRITTGKFMATPRGIVELKMFFGSGVQNAYALNSEDSVIAAKSVAQRIRSMIKKESKERPFSDQDLVQALKIEGVIVARRTVTKYRESLSIPSSVDRRRGYSLGTLSI